jgi:leucyl-tRNA synthetase
MFMGPLDVSRPWNTADIVGVHRFLQRVWRNVIDESTGEPHVTAEPADTETRRLLHQTIDAVGNDMARMSFNTAIARLFELNNRLTKVVEETGEAPEEVVEPLALMLAPLAPHLAEEVWERLGHEDSLAYVDFPTADPAWLAVETVEIAVQLNGKVRARLTVDADLDRSATEAAARGDSHVASLLDGATVRKVVVVPGRLVNFVLG